MNIEVDQEKLCDLEYVATLYNQFTAPGGEWVAQCFGENPDLPLIVF